MRFCFPPILAAALFLGVFLFPLPLLADAASQLTLPPGFKISEVGAGLGRPRGMALSPGGVLYFCDITGGRVLGWKEGAGKAPAGFGEVVRGLKRPHSLAFHGGYLHVGETHRISRFSLGDVPAGAEEGRTLVELPPDGAHFSRTLAFGPDGKMYIGVGSSCNVCQEEDWRRAAILRCGADGSKLGVFAKGIRNPVPLVFHPETGQLWSATPERDFLGDNAPPECVYVVREGRNYGWPHYYFAGGKPVRDDRVPKGPKPTGAPLWEYQAHATPLGLMFYRGADFPERYGRGFFVTMHGSWNSSKPVGYEVLFVPLDPKGRPGKAEVFIGGFLKGIERIARPVDMVQAPGGGFFLSDDHGGRIFKVTYEGN